MSHVHAHLMMEYAKDATETDKPWERWEYSYKGEKFQTLNNHPQWDVSFDYRRKPKVILINGYEVPEPCRTPLQIGRNYYVPALFGCNLYQWRNDGIDNTYLQNGFVHLTEEAAEKHFEALKSFTAKN